MDLKQAGILFIGLAIAGGFAFGGIASYAGLVDSGGRTGGGEQFNSTLPSSNLVQGSFELGLREQRVLAAQNDVVFLNVFYRDEVPEYDYSSLPDNLSGRVYIQVANSSETALDDSYGLTEFPQALVVGGTRDGVSISEDASPEALGSAACDAYRSWEQGVASVVGYCSDR